ncbi:hypothetical protein V6N13_120500 [Hibiscus sabdariffa]
MSESVKNRRKNDIGRASKGNSTHGDLQLQESQLQFQLSFSLFVRLARALLPNADENQTNQSLSVGALSTVNR